MTRILPRALATAGVAALLVAGLTVPASAAGGTTVYVLASDLSSVNVSAASTKWDAPTLATAATLPATGTKWALDIENKPLGASSVTADGLVLTVATVPAPQKVRYQYYIGSGGYPTVDALDPTLDDLLASPISWDLKLLSGDRTVYGPVFQVQLQKLLPGNSGYARVTVQTVWNPADGTRDLQNGLWFSNTAIYAGGYPANTTTYAPTGGTVLNNAGSGPGVSAQILADNFGDFEVVSFGPNLGRDFPYSWAFQNVTALGHTFQFVTQLPAAPPAPPASSGGTTTPPTTTSSRSTNSGELPTFALPTPTPTPSPSQSEEPAAPSDDDGDDGDEVVVADPPVDDGGGFPVWLLLLGVGFLVLLLAFLVWLLRRRNA